MTITSAYGQTFSVDNLNDVIKPAVSAKGYSTRKLQEAEELTERLTQGVKMVSGSPLFDGFVKQAYLDNMLRGGMPAIMGTPDKSKASPMHNTSSYCCSVLRARC